MKFRPRIYYSDAQKALMWDRWEKGDSVHTIARLFDRAIDLFSVFCRRQVGYYHYREVAPNLT